MKRIYQTWIVMCIVAASFCFISMLIKHQALWFGDYSYQELNNGWSYTDASGENYLLTLPDKVEVSDSKRCEISNTLPQVEEGQVICVRSSLQDINVYVDDRLVNVYSNEDTRRIGRVTPSAWIFIPLLETDSGKEIRIVYSSYYKDYCGTLNQVYCGDKSGIIFHLIRHNLVPLVCGFLIVIFGVIALIFTLMARTKYSGLRQLKYLAFFAVCIGGWFLCESKVRQVYSGNIFLLHNMAFVFLMLMPFPLMSYINELQQKKYEKGYCILGAIQSVYFFASIIIVVLLRQMDFLDFLMLSFFFLLCDGAYMIGTVFHYFYHQARRGVAFLMGACALLTVSGLCELLAYFTGDYITTGHYLCIGMLLFLLLNAFGSAQNLLYDYGESKRERAESSAKTKFLASMSHELRTPMYAICGMADVLAETNLPIESREHVDTIRNSAENMLTIINDILELSNINLGNTPIVESEYELLPLLQDMLALTRYRVSEKEVAVIYHVDEKTPSKFFGDSMRIRQVLNNVLGNASKFTVEGSIKLSVSWQNTTYKNGYLRFVIEDTGCGIKADKIDWLFSDFTQLDEHEHKHVEGSGVGLVICKKVLLQMGGNITLSSQSGVGTSVTVELPQGIVDDTPLDAQSLSKIYDRKAEQVTITFKAPDSKMLVVDDNSANLLVAQALLKRYEGKVFLAESGERALAILKERQDIDIVFLDLMMPEIDGFETAKRIRQLEGDYFRSLPLVALTANAIGGTKERAFLSGMNEFLTKPLQTAALDRVLADFLPKEKQVVSATTKELEWDEDTLPKKAEYEAFLAGLDSLNVAEGLHYCMDRADVYYNVLESFAEPELEERIAESWLQKDIKNYTVGVHSLKSSARNIGADELSDMAYQLEKAGKRGDTTYMIEHHNSCMEAYEKIRQEVQRALKEVNNEQVDVIPVKQVSLRERNRLIKKLETALMNMDPLLAQKAMKEVEEVAFEEWWAESLLYDMKTDIDNYDFDLAEEKLSDFCKRMEV